MSQIDNSIIHLPTTTDEFPSSTDPDKKPTLEHFEYAEASGINLADAAHASVGMAVIEQKKVIPSTGERIPTTKWEY